MKKNLFKEISIFLYAFALALFQYTIFELAISNYTITKYRMNFTLGVLFAIFIISSITVIYMSDRFEKLRKAIFDTKLNKYSTVFGLISTVILCIWFFNFTIAKIGILMILFIIISSSLVAWILEKKSKNYK